MDAASPQQLAERFRRARRDPGLAVLEGLHALKHALRFGADVRAAIAVDPPALERLAADLAPDVAGRIARLVEPVDAATLARACDPPPPTGVVALARRPAHDPLRALREAEGPVLLLDRPRALGNVGAAIRVAAAAGAAAVLTTGTLDPWDPRALRGSAGLHFALPVARIDALGELAGRPLVALDPGGDARPPARLPRRCVLAVGGERSGLAPDLLARADVRLAIPMRPGVSSLNLATALAAALYGWGLADARYAADRGR